MHDDEGAPVLPGGLSVTGAGDQRPTGSKRRIPGSPIIPGEDAPKPPLVRHVILVKVLQRSR